jgi:FixJ family two-component response regulator
MTIPSSVAVIEDDADERTALGRVLRASGFDVKSYASAEDFLASGTMEALCLLLDLQLEGMSGLELLRDLRMEGSTLPVIVITASDDTDSRREAEQLGCFAYLRKPFQGRALVALLRTLASTRRPSHDLSN